MSTLAVVALLPFILILTYVAIADSDWSTRRCARITLGCFLAVITAWAV
jgi:hypothetical protein